MSDHCWLAPDAPCWRCGITLADWAKARTGCLPAERAGPDLSAEQARIWECVVAAVRGTQAEGEGDDQT